MKDLRNWFHKLTCLGNRSTAVRKPSRTRLSLEGLEARDMPSVTDMTQLAAQFTPHSAPTVLYINFGGTGSSAVAGQVVAAYQSAPGGNRAADIQEITKQTSEIFAPFRLEVVPVDQAGWYDSSSLGNTTIFVGANAKDVDSVGNKAIESFTPAAYVDAPGINKGYTHQPNSDPFDLAFVDPVGTVRPGLTQTQESDLLIAQQITHEAGHTFGLEHVSTGTDPDVMSYTSGLNQAFLDKTYNVTDLNYDPSKTPSTYHGGASFYAQWQEANGTIDTITTQDSFTYLQAVLGRSSDQSAVQRNANGLEQLFVIGADHAVWTQTQVTPGGAYGPWSSLGGYALELEAGKNAGGKIELFVIGGDHQVYHNQQAYFGGGFTGWYSLGGYVTQFAIGTNADGRLELFGIGGDHQLYQNSQTAPGSFTPYTGWGVSLGGYVKQVTVASNVDGRLEVFMIGGENAVWSRKQVTPGGALGGWTFLDGFAKQISVGVTKSGALDVYAIGGDNEVFHRQQTTPGGGYNGWVDLGGNVKQITVGTNTDGRMEVFAINSNNAVEHLWQSTPGNYVAWGNLDGNARQITLGTNADGSFDLIAVAVGGDVWDREQGTPGSEIFNGWTSHGGLVV